MAPGKVARGGQEPRFGVEVLPRGLPHSASGISAELEDLIGGERLAAWPRTTRRILRVDEGDQYRVHVTVVPASATRYFTVPTCRAYSPFPRDSVGAYGQVTCSVPTLSRPCRG